MSEREARLRTQKAYSKELAERYDLRHFGGKSGHHILQKDSAALAALLPPPPGLVLDIPCGTGIYTARFATYGYDLVAADASSPMLEITGQRGASTPRTLCSIHQLPFADNTFDATMTLRLFSHFEPNDVVRGLVELRRVIKPGGRVIFDTFRWTPRRWPVLRRFVAQSYIYEIASADVQKLIQEAGLRTVATKTCYLFSPIWQRKLPYILLRTLTALETLLPDRLLLREFWACQ